MPLQSYTSPNQNPVVQKVRFPFGPWDVIVVPFLPVMNVTVDNSSSLRFAQLTANATINLTNIPVDLPIGTQIALVIPTAGVQVLTLGTGFQSNPQSFTGIASATHNWLFAWNGTNFVPASPPVRVT